MELKKKVIKDVFGILRNVIKGVLIEVNWCLWHVFL